MHISGCMRIWSERTGAHCASLVGFCVASSGTILGSMFDIGLERFHSSGYPGGSESHDSCVLGDQFYSTRIPAAVRQR